jgi:hypothetical protein
MRKGEETGRPRPAHVAYRGGEGHGARGGRGTQTQFACPFPSAHPPHARCTQRGEGADVEEGGGGREEGAVLPLLPTRLRVRYLRVVCLYF